MFGPSIIGEEAFKAQQEAQKKAAHIYGPRVTENDYGVSVTGEAAEESDETPDAPPEITELTVAEVRSALAGNGAMVEPLLEAELARDNPRKSALKSILETEMGREPEPRGAIVNQIEAALDELG